MAGMISAPSDLRGINMGLRELVDAADYGIPYVNSPLSTRRAFIKSNRDTALRILRAYYEAVQETRNDKNSALKILESTFGSMTRNSSRKSIAATDRTTYRNLSVSISKASKDC